MHITCNKLVRLFPYQFVFEPFTLDVELHSGRTGTGTRATGTDVVAASSAASTVGAAAVVCPADLVDSNAAKTSTT